MSANIFASNDASDEISGIIDVSFRYRFEKVELDGFNEDAQASTIRSRATIKTKWNSRWDSVIEFDDVSEIGMEDFNAGLMCS